MRRVLTLYSTTIGKKIVMAVTGILLVGFVLGHMIGNLKLYMEPHHGDYALDHYGHALRTFGEPFFGEYQFLWLVRGILLLAVILHIWSAISLKALSNRARPQGYAKSAYEESTIASRTMIWGGILLAVFIVFHILHFTTGTISPGMDFQYGEVHMNVTQGFGVWWVAAFYAIAMVALGMHLYHGVWSMLQTLGANHPRYNHWRKRLAVALAVVIAVANISFPVAVLTGAVERIDDGDPQTVEAPASDPAALANKSQEVEAWN